MPSIDIRETGIVYRNPKPFLHSRQAFFPTAAQLDDGELVVAMDIGQAFESVDVRSYLSRSRDGGRSWSEPRIIFSPDESLHPVSTTVRISRMPGGELLGWAAQWDRTHTSLGLVNPGTNGFVDMELACLRSDDGGHSWKSRPVDPPFPWRTFETAGSVQAIDERRRMMPASLFTRWDGHRHPGIDSVAFVSDDGGRTWDRGVSLFDFGGEPITAYETRLLRLADGRVMAVTWCNRTDTQQVLHNHYCLSRDRGDTFQKPLASPVHGETNEAIALPGNRVLCVYRRHDKKGLWAHLAQIEGDRWVPLADRPLWGTEMSARPDDRRGGTLENLSFLRFGSPSAIELHDGSFFVVFWCVEECQSVIRWLTLDVA
ncbi:MAG: sialidase family protein [Planctomycetia bacterium]